MQSGTTSSLYRLAERLERDGAPTRVDITQGQRPEGAAAQSGSKDFFGEDGLSFRDVLDAINPLNHLPIVSDIMKEQTGHQVSTASRLIGGALMGGPIGFIASIASMAFEDATGKSPVEAVYAALTGDVVADEVQVAENAAPIEKVEEEAASIATPANKQAAMVMASLEPETQAALAVSRVAHAVASSPSAHTDKDNAILELYGKSGASAHSSYKKAQMLPYLRDVTTSHVL